MPPRDSIAARNDEDLLQSHPARNGPRGALARGLAVLRNVWRRLTSMRTALILLFLLALASLPGALLPQWSTNRPKTAQYILDHPTIGPWLNRLGFFNVFSAPWFAAVYLLLFISLVGCLTPRSWELLRQIRTGPPASAPRNLSRLPHHATVTITGDATAAGRQVADRLRHAGVGGWRTATRTEPDGAVVVAAEKGYLRDVGNLVFHFSLVGLLLSVAVGGMFGYEGTVLVTEGDGFCASSPIAYDDFRPGPLVNPTTMTPFCVDVDAFHAAYTPQGQATTFRADIRFQTGGDLGTDTWRRRALEVNDPLRFSGDRLYLLGHGYTPTFRITYPDGQVRSYQQPFAPEDSMFTSQGAIKVTDPPGYSAADLRKNQLAIVGIFAPTAVVRGGIMSSGFPSLLSPGVAVDVYRGDLGMASGIPQSVFAIDTAQVANGLLVKKAHANLSPGQSVTLDDGTKITFTGAKQFVSLQTSYDPAQDWALVSVIALIAGLMASLLIKRRRVWFRIRPDAAPFGTAAPARHGLCIEIGGLARTDQAGYGREFASLVALAPGTESTAAGGVPAETVER
jgi:cytochrome c biogenesis protein